MNIQKRYPILCAAFALSAATGVHAAGQPSNDQEATESEQESTNTIVCRRVAAPTGSRIGARRVCRTEREWSAINDETRDVLEDAQFRSKGWSDNGQ